MSKLDSPWLEGREAGFYYREANSVGVQVAAIMNEMNEAGTGPATDEAERGAQVVIPAKRNRKTPIPHDEEIYKWRHLIKNYFSKIKEFRGVNTRYDKTDTSYEATWYIAATVIALR